MLSTPLSRLNISCACTQCTAFLRPYPKDTPQEHLPPTLSLPFAFSLPPTPAATPKTTPKQTPRLLPPHIFTAPSTATFDSTAPAHGHAQTYGHAHADEDAKHRATLLSRTLWASLSSPLSDSAPLLSARTPGLALCASAGCARRVVPGFGGAVCGVCVEAVRGAVMGMESRGFGGCEGRGVGEWKEGDEDEGMDEEQDEEEQEDEEFRFALPTCSTPPSTRLLLTHSLHSSRHSSSSHSRNSSTSTTSTSTDHDPTHLQSSPLFALPNVSLDAEAYEEVTPTTKYAMEFPALPMARRGGALRRR